MSRRAVSLLLVVAACTVVSHPKASTVTDLELTISGDAFEVNGDPLFLPIASYFDAIHASLGDIDDDFQYLKADGFEGVRIFPNWYRIPGPPDSTNYYFAQDTLFDKNGNLRSATLTKLLDVLDLAKDHGLIVDLSFSVETVVDCPADNCTGSYTTALTYAEYKNGLEDITTALANAGSAYKHVMFDLQNEYNKPNKPNDLLTWDESDMDDLAEAVHAIDSDRIVFASLTSTGLTATQAANKADTAELDVAVIHEPRVEDWGNNSDQRAIDMDAATPLPVYFQESPRYRTGSQSTSSWWTSSQAEKSLCEALEKDAAAWNFHSGASFNLNGASLYDNLATVSADNLFVTTQLAAVLTDLNDGTCSMADFTAPEHLESEWLRALPLTWARGLASAANLVSARK